MKRKIEDENFFRDIKLEKLDQYKAPLKRIEKGIKSLECEIEAKERLIKQYYEKSAAFYESNTEKAKVFEDLADTELKQSRARRITLDKLKQELAIEDSKVIDLSAFKNIKKALKFITDEEIKSFEEVNQGKKQQFIKTYFKSVRIEYLENETKHLRTQIAGLKELGLWKKENKPYAELYFSVFDKTHQPKLKHQLIALRLAVEFTNNYVVNVDLPYFSANPELSVSYLSNGQISL